MGRGGQAFERAACAAWFPAVAIEDVEAARSFIVYPGRESYPLGDGITAIPLPALMELLIGQS